MKTKIEQLCTLLDRREKRKEFLIEKKETWMTTHTQSTWCEHYPLVGTQHTSTMFFIKKFKKQHENIKMPLIIHVNQCESKKKKKNLQVQTLFLVFSNYKQKLYSICMNCFYSVSFLFFNSE